MGTWEQYSRKIITYPPPSVKRILTLAALRYRHLWMRIQVFPGSARAVPIRQQPVDRSLGPRPALGPINSTVKEKCSAVQLSATCYVLWSVLQ